MTHKTRARILTIAFFGFAAIIILAVIGNTLPDANPRKAECDRQFGKGADAAYTCRVRVGLDEKREAELHQLKREMDQLAR